MVSLLLISENALPCSGLKVSDPPLLCIIYYQWECVRHARSVSQRNTSSRYCRKRSLHTSYSDLCSEHHGIVCCTEPLTQSSPSMLKSFAVFGITVPTLVRALQHPGWISCQAKACPDQWEIEKGVLPSWPYTASCPAANPANCWAFLGHPAWKRFLRAF